MTTTTTTTSVTSRRRTRRDAAPAPMRGPASSPRPRQTARRTIAAVPAHAAAAGAARRSWARSSCSSSATSSAARSTRAASTTSTSWFPASWSRSILWTGMNTPAGVAEDATSGVHDRFRSLPIPRVGRRRRPIDRRFRRSSSWTLVVVDAARASRSGSARTATSGAVAARVRAAARGRPTRSPGSSSASGCRRATPRRRRACRR